MYFIFIVILLSGKLQLTDTLHVILCLLRCVYTCIQTYIKIFPFHVSTLEKKLYDRYSAEHGRRVSSRFANHIDRNACRDESLEI